MAHSKGHHFIPQFLLKGFASRTTKKEWYAFVFRASLEPRESNIRDIGKQRFFHDHPVESDLEHLISLKESDHAKLIVKLRAGELCLEDKTLLDEFVIHLGLRTRNLRDGLTGIGTALFDHLEQKFFGSAEGQKQFEYAALVALKKELQENVPLRTLLMALPPALRKSALDETIARIKHPNATGQALALLRQLRDGTDLAAATAKTHVKLLSASQMENTIQNRREHFAGLTWSVVQQPESTFILGDVGPFAKYHNSTEYTHLVKVEGSLDLVAVPISSSQLLLGQRDGFIADLTPGSVNTISAELSRDFYVASRNTIVDASYQTVLGKRRELVTEKEFLGLSPFVP